MIEGSIVALITPMDVSGAVDYEALERLVEWHIAEGTHAIVAMGTTGESATLSHEEHRQVIRETIRIANQRIPIVAGTGSNSTQEAIDLSLAALEDGADACLQVAPYYNKPPQEGLYHHFSAIAEAVAIPHILYDVPGRTSVNIENDTVFRLAEINNIIAIKDATGDVERGKQLIKQCGESLAVISGDDATALELILAGGKGDISVTANVAPKKMAQMCEAALAGDREKAIEINQSLEALHQDLFVESNPIPVKWAMAQMGYGQDKLRLPLVPLAPIHRDTVKNAMDKAYA